MPTRAQIEKWFQDFSTKKILVVGDVMVDAYIWGKVSRISPEAPVPIINITKREERPGGAANVALNLNALGASTFILATIGKDNPGHDFKKLLEEQGINTQALISDPNRNTTIKTRIISQGQQMLRVDEEDSRNINADLEDQVLDMLQQTVAKNSIDAIVLEDYNKGLLTPRVIKGIIDFARKNHIPVTVDPKKENFFAYKGATLFKPNLKELAEGLKHDINPNSEDDVMHALEELKIKMDLRSSMVTLSEYGVQCLAEDFTGRIPAHKREISDVSGAGDTVIATFTLSDLCGATPKESVLLSNFAAGRVCEEVGVVPISLTMLNEMIEHHNNL